MNYYKSFAKRFEDLLCEHLFPKDEWVDEHAMVQELKRKYAVDFCTFLDENLMTMDAASRYQWMPAVCDEWIRRGFAPDAEGKGGIHWAGTSHASLYRPSTLHRMRESGCMVPGATTMLVAATSTC